MALQQESNKQLTQQRLNLFRFPVLLIFLILAARLWQLQIIQGADYALKAERNRIRIIELAAPRGIIADRNHIPLAENQPSFDVLLYREWMKDEAATARFLTEKLGIVHPIHGAPDLIQEFVREFHRRWVQSAWALGPTHPRRNKHPSSSKVLANFSRS